MKKYTIYWICCMWSLALDVVESFVRCSDTDFLQISSISLQMLTYLLVHLLVAEALQATRGKWFVSEVFKYPLSSVLCSVVQGVPMNMPHTVNNRNYEATIFTAILPSLICTLCSFHPWIFRFRVLIKFLVVHVGNFMSEFF